jgi:hypothetical protein
MLCHLVVYDKPFTNVCTAPILSYETLCAFSVVRCASGVVTPRLLCRRSAPFVSYERAPLFKEGKEKKYVRCFGSGKGESLPSTVLFFVTRMFSVAIERPGGKERCGSQPAGTKNLQHHVSDHFDLAKRKGIGTERGQQDDQEDSKPQTPRHDLTPKQALRISVTRLRFQCFKSIFVAQFHLTLFNVYCHALGAITDRFSMQNANHVCLVWRPPQS